MSPPLSLSLSFIVRHKDFDSFEAFVPLSVRRTTENVRLAIAAREQALQLSTVHDVI